METDLKKITEAVNQLKTGDVVSFRGERLFSKFVKFWQKTFQDPGDDTYQISHVSLVVKEDWTDNMPVSIESLWNPLKGYDGVVAIPMQKRLQMYNGSLAFHILQKDNKDVELTREQKEQLRESFETYKGRKFERRFFSMLKSAIDNSPMFSENKKDTSMLFCSEFTAQIYLDIGLLKGEEEKPSSEYTPVEFMKAKLEDGYSIRDGISVMGGTNIKIKNSTKKKNG